MIHKTLQMNGNRAFKKNSTLSRAEALVTKAEPRPRPVHEQDPQLAYIEEALSPFWAWRITTH